MDVESLRSAVRAAVERNDAAAAWALLEPHRTRADQERELALLFLELLRISPDRPSGAAEAFGLARLYPGDVAVVGMVCRAVIAIAELRPMDEPPLAKDSIASQAAELAESLLAGLDAAAQQDPQVGGWIRSLAANAYRLAGPAYDAQAVAAFERALASARDDGHLWFDFALLHKWRGRFQAGYDCNLRAQARLGDTRPVLWNLGICATAIGDGNVAGLCWKKLGFTPELHPKSGHAFVDGLPPMQLRVLSKGSGYGFGGPIPEQAVGFEVVWVQPLSPCHGVVISPTFRDAPIDYGDVVLWDGAPVTVADGPNGPVPRFALLEILRKGDERRLRFVALEQKKGDIEALESALPEGSQVFVQHERVEHVCPVCASGDALRKHEHLPPEDHRILYGKIVTSAEVALPTLQAAIESEVRKQGRVQIAVPELYDALGDSARAGKEHQAWRGIERIAIKKGLAPETRRA